MLLNVNLLFDIPADPGGISVIGVAVLLLIVLLMVAGFIGAFVVVLVWRKRSRNKTEALAGP